MKKIFLVLVFSGLLFSAVPSWVQPGVSVVYDTYSAFVNDGSYQNAVYATLTINTNSISGNLVSGITYMEIPSIPGYITEYPWSCYEEDTCDWEFFVDVLNPTESITGPFGEEYTIIGNTNYSYGSVYFEDVTVMFYSNEETGVVVSCNL